MLCNGVVDRLMRLDRDRVFRYASLQGETAATVRERVAGFPDDLETFVYVHGEEVHLRSSAVFEIARRLPFPWRVLAWFRILPRFLTDAVYRFVAKNRIRWFGRTESCRMPSEEDASLLLP